MASISLLKGPKEVLQIEFSRVFALRYAVHLIRYVQKLLLRSTHLRIVVLFIFAVLIIAYTFYSGQDRLQDSSWMVPETCGAGDCHIKQPLLMAELSPNLLLILIHSSVGGYARRDAIRKTWLSHLTNKESFPIQYRFVLGGKYMDEKTLKIIQKESQEFEDILVLPDVTDSIYSLTYRTIGSFKHTYYRMNKFLYIMKCDDDTVVDVMRIASELQLRKTKGLFFWGYMKGSAPVLRWHLRYSESNWFICKKYLPYAFGGGYLLSGELVGLLVQNEQFLKMYNNEDVAIGSWLATYNLEYKHDSRFNTESSSRGCKYPFLILHKVSTSEMFYYHNSYEQEDRYCSWRTNWHSYHGYLYNWKALPLDCCLRNVAVP